MRTPDGLDGGGETDQVICSFLTVVRMFNDIVLRPLVIRLRNIGHGYPKAVPLGFTVSEGAEPLAVFPKPQNTKV